MADVFELDYLYSRVCGSFSKAFLGGKGAALASCNSIGELWRAVFGSPPPEITGPGLVRSAERRFMREAMADFMKLASCLPFGDRFVDAMSRKTEYAWVKSIVSAIRAQNPQCPPVPFLGLLPDFKVSAYPETESMFGKGRYSWINNGVIADQAVFENRLDRQYYSELWDAACAIPKGKAGDIPRLVQLEAELQNVIWALRLRRYYGFKEAEVRDRLISLSRADIFSPALESTRFAMDHRQDWSGWKWEKLLGTAISGSEWKLDLRELEMNARRVIFRSVRRALHLFPATYTPLYCHFKMKEYETALVSGLFEGMAIGSPTAETEAYAFSVTGGAP